MHTGENEQGLRKVLDMTRLISFVLLLLHFYFYCYAAFRGWRLTSVLSDRLLANLVRTGLFDNFQVSKSLSLLFLAISLAGVKGRKDQRFTYRSALVYLTCGIAFFYVSCLLLRMECPLETRTIFYISGPCWATCLS